MSEMTNREYLQKVLDKSGRTSSVLTHFNSRQGFCSSICTGGRYHPLMEQKHEASPLKDGERPILMWRVSDDEEANKLIHDLLVKGGVISSRVLDMTEDLRSKDGYNYKGIVLEDGVYSGRELAMCYQSSRAAYEQKLVSGGYTAKEVMKAIERLQDVPDDIYKPFLRLCFYGGHGLYFTTAQSSCVIDSMHTLFRDDPVDYEPVDILSKQVASMLQGVGERPTHPAGWYTSFFRSACWNSLSGDKRLQLITHKYIASNEIYIRIRNCVAGACSLSMLSTSRAASYIKTSVKGLRGAKVWYDEVGAAMAEEMYDHFRETIWLTEEQKDKKQAKS